MRLLIVTQKVDKNAQALGFFHGWLVRFAALCSEVTVICLEKGEYDLPSNIRVLTLGKEEGQSRIKYVSRFYRYILRERDRYDAVFVHMNPEYVILGGLFWKLWNKPIALSYIHRKVNPKLRLATFLANRIFTAVPESFNIQNKKVMVVGHGINIDRFRCSGRIQSPVPLIVHVGRITAIKRCEVLLEAARKLKEKNSSFHIAFIGSQVTRADQEYEKKLRRFVAKHGLEDYVEFRGALPYEQLPQIYCQADLSVNLAPTGGIDKAVLESMAAGTPVIAANRGFAHYFRTYTDRLMVNEDDADDLALKIENLITAEDRDILGTYLASQARENAGEEALVAKIVTDLQQHVRN